MSLKKRRYLTAALGLAAALCLSAGYLLREGARAAASDPQGTTFVQSGGVVTPAPEAGPHSVWLPLALLVLGTWLTIALVCLHRQEKPLLGPDGDLCLLLPAGYVAVTFSAGMSSLPWVFCLAVLGLLSLCGVVAWLRQGAPVSWLAVHRLAERLWRRSQRYWLYPACLLGVLAAGITGGILLRESLPLAAAALFPALGALVCLQRSFTQTGRLLNRIRQPEAPENASGLFQREETLLLEANRQREEAVEQAVAGERFKVELIANVSHDLRTPLTAILGYAELLEKQPLPPEAAGWLSQLTQRAGYMRDLVESLFELTKVSSGVAEAKREPLDLIRLLEQTVAELDEPLRQAGLEARRRYPAQSLPLVSDGGRLHQVFANLLENAAKYAMPGTRVYLEVLPEEKTVTVRLTNTAAYEMDFQPEEITRRFVRGDTARTTKGSGLGLAIAQTYTESLGGQFRVEIDGDQFRAVVTLPI